MDFPAKGRLEGHTYKKSIGSPLIALR